MALFTEAPLAVISALHGIATPKQTDASAGAIFKAFGCQGTLLPFVFKLAEWDVNNCDSEQLLFRRNSLSTKLITMSLKTYGQGYLQKLLQPLLERMLESPGLSYEVNTNNLGKGENLGENRSNLKRLADFLFNSITDSIPRVPLAVNLICHGVLRAAHRRFPDSSYLAVGAAFFLRFLGPALASPEAHGVTEEKLPLKVKRGLLLLSKILQAAALASRFKGFKEEYMQPYNSLVCVAGERGLEFMKKVSSLPGHLDELTLGHFASLGITLRVPEGRSKDLSALGRNQNGTVVNGLQDRDLTALLELLRSTREELLKVLAETGDRIVENKVREALQALGESGPPKKPAPEKWKPRVIARDQMVASLASHSRVDLIVDGGEMEVEGEEYMDTGVQRCYVGHTDWNRILPNYEPSYFTDDSVLQCADGADPDLKQADFQPLAYNAIDDEAGVDRRSFEGTYKVIKGIPRHPLRRTGLAGRGVLKRWGPNHEVLLAATRWARDAEGNVKTINGLKVLETLVLEGDAAQYALPRSERRPDSHLPEVICRELQFSSDSVMFVSRPSTNTTLAEALQHVVLMSKGIVEDPRDTDNAWVERMSLSMHADGDVFPALPANAELRWVQVSRELALPTAEVELLQEVAAAYGAYFADQIPRLLRALLQAIEQRGMSVEGVYRLSGANSRVQDLKARVLKESFEALEDAPVPELTSLVKLLLREMDPPLIPDENYQGFIQAARYSSKQARAKAMSAQLKQLPTKSYRQLDLLFRHLRRIMAQQQSNRMNAENLALVFGPTIMRSPDGLSGDMESHGGQVLAVRALLNLPASVWSKNANIGRMSVNPGKRNRRRNSRQNLADDLNEALASSPEGSSRGGAEDDLELSAADEASGYITTLPASLSALAAMSQKEEEEEEEGTRATRTDNRKAKGPAPAAPPKPKAKAAPAPPPKPKAAVQQGKAAAPPPPPPPKPEAPLVQDKAAPPPPPPPVPAPKPKPASRKTSEQFLSVPGGDMRTPSPTGSYAVCGDGSSMTGSELSDDNVSEAYMNMGANGEVCEAPSGRSSPRSVSQRSSLRSARPQAPPKPARRGAAPPPVAAKPVSRASATVTIEETDMTDDELASEVCMGTGMGRQSCRLCRRWSC